MTLSLGMPSAPAPVLSPRPQTPQLTAATVARGSRPPNPVPPMIEVITQPAGSGAEDVERFVTVPLETALAGMHGLEHVRSQSLFGLSDVKCYFSWDTPYKDARQEVLNRLQMAELPPGVQPTLSPWSPIGEIFRYVLRGEGYSLTDLKSAQDWILEKQFRQVPGVVDVVGCVRGEGVALVFAVTGAEVCGGTPAGGVLVDAVVARVGDVEDRTRYH